MSLTHRWRPVRLGLHVDDDHFNIQTSYCACFKVKRYFAFDHNHVFVVDDVASFIMRKSLQKICITKESL